MSRGLRIKEIEEFPRRLKIFFVIIISLLFFGILGFKFLTKIGFEEALIRTLQTLAFMFSEDSNLLERLLEIFLAIVGVFLVWWVLWSVADMLLDGNLAKYLKTIFYNWRIGKMEGHIIIAGGGRVGEEIAKALIKKKSKFLLIDNNELVVKSLRKKGYIVLEGNAEIESTLKEAGIEFAKKIILTLPKTETNILITLTVKEINPSVEVYSRADNPSLVSKLKKAGAKAVVVPELVAGDKFIEDLGL